MVELVTVCAFCKKAVKDNNGEWSRIEPSEYALLKDSCELTHSICPDCEVTEGGLCPKCNRLLDKARLTGGGGRKLEKVEVCVPCNFARKQDRAVMVVPIGKHIDQLHFYRLDGVVRRGWVEAGTRLSDNEFTTKQWRVEWLNKIVQTVEKLLWPAEAHWPD